MEITSNNLANYDSMVRDQVNVQFDSTNAYNMVRQHLLVDFGSFARNAPSPAISVPLQISRRLLLSSKYPLICTGNPVKTGKGRKQYTCQL